MKTWSRQFLAAVIQWRHSDVRTEGTRDSKCVHQKSRNSVTFLMRSTRAVIEPVRCGTSGSKRADRIQDAYWPEQDRTVCVGRAGNNRGQPSSRAFGARANGGDRCSFG